METLALFTTDFIKSSYIINSRTCLVAIAILGLLVWHATTAMIVAWYVYTLGFMAYCLLFEYIIYLTSTLFQWIGDVIDDEVPKNSVPAKKAA